MQNAKMHRGFLILCWENLFSLVILNLLFILCCIPVVTLPAAATALSRGCQSCLNEEGKPVKLFFVCFQRTVFRAMPMGLALIAGHAGLIYCIVFYVANYGGSIVGMACAMFCMVAFYLLFAITSCVFQIQVRMECVGRVGLRNAVRITIWEYQLLFTWIALSFGVLGVVAWLFPHTFPLALLLAFSLSNMAAARGVLPHIEKHLKELM